MPEQTPPPVLQEANLESEPLKLGTQSLTDEYALSLVNNTFYSYEWFRQQNHDPRFTAHEALYFGWLPPRVWEGTTTPRASLSRQITFDQVETAYPAICQALFTDDQWFQVEPEPGADVHEARGIANRLAYNLEHGEDNKSSTIDVGFAIKQVLKHGNGVVAVEYDADLQRPVLRWVNLLDLYIDPHCPTPYADDNRAIIERRLLTVEEVWNLRHDPRMKIPAREILNYFAANPSYAYSDKTKQLNEAFRGVQFNPAQHEWTPLPSDRKLEVLIYWSKTRIIWILNRKWVAYNQKNPYGFLPFCAAPCFSVDGRFYAQSFCDVLENDQRYLEALMNGHLDELALNLHPPRVKKRGGLLTPSQQRWRPGQIQEVENPKDDVVVQWPQNATADVMSDISYLETSAEKRTGVNSTGMGVPRPGNVNRTATGVSSQLQGGASRLWTLVKNIEDFMLVPALYKMYRLEQYHSTPGQMLPALGDDDKVVQVGAEAFHKPVRFRMLASSKMLTREKLQQVAPFILQYVMNGAFLQELGKVGKTVDFEELLKMIQDATGTGSSYSLVRQMTQQEQQAMQTPPPQVAMQQQLAQLDSQTRQSLMQQKVQGELQKVQLQKQSDPGQQMAEQAKMAMEMRAKQQEMAMDAKAQQQKMLMDHLAHQQKLRHEAQSNQQKLLLEAMMGQHQIVQQRQQMAQQAQEHQQNLAMQQQQGLQDREMNAQAGQQKLEMDRAAGVHKMSMEHERNKMQLRQQSALAKLKPSAAPAKKK